MKGKLMVVDGNSIANRAFYGLHGPQLLATSDGLYTNALYGFLNILFKYLEEESPEYICVAFDLKAPTFRHLEFEGYKAERKGMPDELAVQMPWLKELLDAMNITRLEKEGFEADDIIGTVSLVAQEEGLECVIITGDRDALQLVSDRCRVKIPTTRKGKTETDDYDIDKIKSKYGLNPAQLIDVKGLMGDQSDNIPGVPGIGEKTALALIQEFGSLEGVYENLDKIKGRKGIKENLEKYRDQAFLSKHLATINRQVPDIGIDESFSRSEFNRPELYKLLKRLEFRSFIEKLHLSEVRLENPEEAKAEVKILCNYDELSEAVDLVRRYGRTAFFMLLSGGDIFSQKMIAFSFTAGSQSFFVRTGDGFEEKQVLKILEPVFADGNISKFTHNLKPVLVYLMRNGIEADGFEFDTLIGAYILDPSRENYYLDELAREYLNKTITGVEELTGKGKSAKSADELTTSQICGLMGCYTVIISELAELFMAKIKERGQERLLYDIELPLVEVLASMEYWGFKVDPVRLHEFSDVLEKRIDDLTRVIYLMAGEEFNINSTKQLGTILFEKLKLPVVKKTKTGYSTDAEVLEKLEPEHEIISGILQYRQLVKLKSTYVDGLLAVINPKTGKIHSSFNQTVTVTGRISSTEPNLQNIPIKMDLGREIRKVFIPSSSDYILADADYSQIELRVLAHVTGDPNMIDAFRNNLDIHRMTASQVFGVPPEEVTPLMRSRAKAVNFGIVYGISDFGLARDLNITRREAKSYIEGYLNRYVNVRRYMHDIVETGREQGYVTTLFNRRRYLPELKSKNAVIRGFGERIAMNTPIQGSAADIIKIAMVNVYRELKRRKMKSRLILQVHDELIVETERSEKEEVGRILKECMESAVELKVPLTVDMKFGENWFETK